MTRIQPLFKLLGHACKLKRDIDLDSQYNHCSSSSSSSSSSNGGIGDSSRVCSLCVHLLSNSARMFSVGDSLCWF